MATCPCSNRSSSPGTLWTLLIFQGRHQNPLVGQVRLEPVEDVKLLVQLQHQKLMDQFAQFEPLMKLAMYTLTKVAIRYWQSKQSMIPPCPGMVLAKSLILKARLNPLAKKPLKGPMSEAKKNVIIAKVRMPLTRQFFHLEDRLERALLRTSVVSSTEAGGGVVSARLSLSD